MADLDRKLINKIGRIPTCIITGGIAGAVVDSVIRVARYIFDFEDVYIMIDNIFFYLVPHLKTIALYGALGGLFVGLISGAATGKAKRKIVRVGIGLVTGLIARAIGEFVVRTITEGQLESGLDYVWILREQIILSGAMVGLMIGLLPLPDKPL